MGPCNRAENCTRFGCRFDHPKWHRGDCNNGADCTRSDCHFLHPSGRNNDNWNASPSGGMKGRGNNTQHQRQSQRQQQQQCGRGRGRGRGGTIVPHGNNNQAAVRGGTGPQTLRVLRNDGHGHRESLSVSVTRRTLCFVAGVDTSGSMAGRPTTEAISGLEQVVDIMAPDDLYALFTFASSCQNLHHAMPRHRVNFDQDKKNIEANVGGRTALYDAIAAGIDEMKVVRDRRRDEGDQTPVVFEQLVITDGEDNSSSGYTLDSLRSLVAKPGISNYNLVLIAVGIDSSTASKMRSLCAPQHATFVHVGNVSDLAGVLTDQVVRIKMVLEVDSQRTGRRRQTRAEVTTNVMGVQRAAAQLDRAAGSNLASGTLRSLASNFGQLSLR
eukprot:m.35564 g.35564  ORF g.35564 m.35564 type:complete len:384 (-) comp17161_c1_seq1:53-1204(-)